MALIISYASNGRRAQAELDDWEVDRGPDAGGFWLPEQAEDGDRIAYFIGGKRQEFVATGRVQANWRRAGRGTWKGHEYTWVRQPRPIQPPIGAAEMERLSGLQPPRDAEVVPRHLAAAVWATLQHRPFDPEARALEGTRTEATSKYRSPKLRQAALQRANGVCEGCGIDYGTYAGKLGRRCLVVHHTKQLRDTDEPAWTTVKELAVVCANCHMLIHHDPKEALSIEQLHRVLRS
ncbi:MAG: putative restriction endonuclease [Ilumatobacteraceae bacterium]|nr:putative restriction endonuclease [Ilumatobacteraceae bacterium]